MTNGILLRRFETGAILSQVIKIGAGDDLRLSVRRYRAIQTGLAIETPVHRIRAVLRVRKLARINDSQRPALLFGPVP